MKAILIPGNGGGTPQDNYFPYLERELPKLSIQTINKQFPDAILARKEYWLPFLKEVGADENTILIGHSSGALAAMRYAEQNTIFASILIGACHTDLGYETEKQSHYYDDPWNWKVIRDNQKWIIQFASTDDPYIPIDEARFVHENLNTEYYEYTDQGHFGRDKGRTEFPELVEALKKKFH
jgi:predicted alpha/beta hydrolase family esterase